MSQIVSEWDALAAIRYQQISSGEDISYNSVIVPTLLDLIRPLKFSTALDVGCGTGIFTAQLVKMCPIVTGIDPSKASIEIAHTAARGARLTVDDAEDFSKKENGKFDLVVANMVLMDVIELRSFLDACSKMLTAGGHFVFSITHPCFWPEHYGYKNEPWFDYEREIVVESPFRISADPIGRLFSTHVHRPLSHYLKALADHDLILTDAREPTPPQNVPENYRKNWTAPRYFMGLCHLKRT